MSRRLVKWVQRKAMGGMLYARVYDDGLVRIKADHPSNDPEVEIRMAETVVAILSEKYRTHGLEPEIQSFGWRSDPDSGTDSGSTDPSEGPNRAQNG